MTLKKLVEGTFWIMCYAELSSIMPVFSNRDLQVFRPLCTVFNDIAHSHSPIQQPSLWLSNHRLHLFFFSSLLSLSISLCLFVNLYSSVSPPPPPPSVCPPLSNTNPVVSKSRYWRKCLLTFLRRLVLFRGAVCYLWLRLMWLAEERYNYVWHSA